MTRLREMARRGLQELFRDVADTNADVIHLLGGYIVALAGIRLTAQVGVAAIGGTVGVFYANAALAGGVPAAGLMVGSLPAGASSMTFALTGLGYSVTNSVIKAWEQSAGAKMVAIGSDVGKAVTNDLGGTASDVLHGMSVAQTAAQRNQSVKIIKDADAMIRKQSSRLVTGRMPRYSKWKEIRGIINQSSADIAREKQILAKVGKAETSWWSRQFLGRWGTRGFPVVFAALDIYDAFNDYNTTMKSIEAKPARR